MNVQLTDAWKEGIARLVRRYPLNGMLAWGVRFVVPRQRVGVALITFNIDGEILLLRHVFHTAIPWGLPGGWLGRNEAPEDGLIRELREEIGLDLSLGPPRAYGLREFAAAYRYGLSWLPATRTDAAERGDPRGPLVQS